jgi:Tfp pilus assembly protein PilO
MIGRILPVILILISIGLFAGYINPTYAQKVTPLKAEIKQYDSTLAAAADFNKKEAELAADRNAIPAESIQRLETYLPDGVDNVQLILDLNALAAKSGMQLSNFDIQQHSQSSSSGSGAIPLESGGKATDSLDLTVKATGSYAAFRTFLAGIEQSLRPMDVVQMTLTDSQTGVYTYNITLRIYWLH